MVENAVTTSNALAVAQEVAPHIGPGSIFLDLNSASPSIKQRAAQLIDAACGHFVAEE